MVLNPNTLIGLCQPRVIRKNPPTRHLIKDERAGGVCELIASRSETTCWLWACGSRGTRFPLATFLGWR